MMRETATTERRDHFYRIGRTEPFSADAEPPDLTSITEHRQRIEPWLSAVFQSEHLSLLVGSGFPNAVAVAAGITNAPSMDSEAFDCKYGDKITEHANELARRAGRGVANVEDQIRSANALAGGLEVVGKTADEAEVRAAIRAILDRLVDSVLDSEADLRAEIEGLTEGGLHANGLLCSFLLSFASRAATR
jgi:hypothetical protein